MADLFSPIKIGSTELKNRIVMAPMTRNRAGEGNVPTPLAVTYYEQRAEAGLIITEATQISPQGVGYPKTPGIHTSDQIHAWRRVTEAVHAKQGKIFLQLWHVGRISHPLLQPDGALPVAPSAIKPAGMAITPQGPKPFETPRELSADEITGIINDYAQGAKNAIAAGFDGVEIHGANGYLIDQFLRDGSNKRQDEWGGSVENRAKFLLEVVSAVCQAVGAAKTAVRLSPYGTFNDMSDSDLRATFGHAVREMSRFKLAYLHLIEAMSDQDRANIPKAPLDFFRGIYTGKLMTNGGYNLQSANSVIASGNADMVSFGKPFISNPDLVSRMKNNIPLAASDQRTFYGGDAKGYTDYPRAS